MSQDITAEHQNLPVPYEKERNEGMVPLTKALVGSYSEAAKRFRQLTASFNPDTLPEPDRSGVILMRVILDSYKTGPKKVLMSDNYFDQRELTQIAVNEVKQLVTNLPSWVPVLFKGYKEKFASFSGEKLDFLSDFFAAYEIEQYFGEESCHNFILDCLELSQDETWTAEKQIGNNTARFLNIDKILGNKLERYRNASSQEEGFCILKKAVRQAVLQPNAKLVKRHQKLLP